MSDTVRYKVSVTVVPTQGTVSVELEDVLSAGQELLRESDQLSREPITASHFEVQSGELTDYQRGVIDGAQHACCRMRAVFESLRKLRIIRDYRIEPHTT